MCISKPPRSPLVIGEGKDVYWGLFFSAGGLTYDLPSGALSLCDIPF